MGSVDGTIADLEARLANLERELTEARAEAEAGRFFRKIVDSSSDVVTVIDEEFRIIFASRAFEKLTGVDPRDAIGGSQQAEIHPDDVVSVRAKAAALIAAGPDATDRTELRRRHADGRWVHTEISARNLLHDPYVRGIVINHREIGEAVRLREDLRAARVRYELALSASRETIWERDLAHGTMSFAPKTLAQLGYAEGEIPSGSDQLAALAHPDDVARLARALAAHLEGGAPYDVEVRVRQKSGDHRWYRVAGESIRDASGRPIGMIGPASDIHERKLAEVALRDSERMFRALFEETSAAVTIRDLGEQRFIDCNPAALRLYASPSREHLFGTRPFDLAAPVQPDGRSAKDVLRGMVADATRDGAYRGEWMARRLTGEVFPTEVRITVIALEDGRKIMQTFIEDVTERKRAERTLERRALRDSLVSRVSRQLVEVGAEAAIPFALEALGTFLGVDRVRMRRVVDGGESFVTVADWRAPGVPPFPNVQPSERSALFRWASALLTREGSVAIADLEALPTEMAAAVPNVAGSRVRGLVIVPLTDRGGLVGWIVIEQLDVPRAWTDDDVGVARLIAEIVSMARARAEAEEARVRRAERDELLSEVSRRFLNDDPEEAIDATLERVGLTLGADRVSLFAPDARGERLRRTHRWRASERGDAVETLDACPLPVGAFAPGDGETSEASEEAQRRAEAWLDELNRCSPLHTLHAQVGYRGRVFGLLSMHARDGQRWGEADAATLRLIGELIAVGRVRRAAEIALARAREDAIAASLTKSAFLANMSHELRTPLNGVIGMVDLLATTKLDERQARFAEIARSSASLLLSVINDVLDFSKIEAGKLELESIELTFAEIAEEVASILALSAEEKGLELTCQSAPALGAPRIGDPARLRQVLVNLVSNAIKFTARGEVSLRSSVVVETEGSTRVRVEVRDTGPGISRDAQAKLFQPFSQVDASTTRQHGGTGLGLAICRELVEAMGGAIGVTSTLGSGSTFWFEVPLARPEGVRPLAPEVDAALAGVRVLAVDDNATNREVLQLQLARVGMVCDTAPDGVTALRMLLDAAALHPYALAFIDLHMPGMDGRALARFVMAEPRLRGTRVVILGSVAHPLDAVEQRELGIAGYCAKPLWRGQLLRVLRRALDGALAPDAAARTPERGADGAGAQAQARAARILLVEDSPINAEVAGEVLRSAGYAFDLAGDGRLAVEAARANAYDLVLMDCQLPEVDGFEATRTIRLLERDGALPGRHDRPLPVVALTASATKGDIDRCFAAGMNDYVSKPLDARRLLAVVAAQLGARPVAPAAQAAPAARREDDHDSLPVVDLGRALERLRGDRALLTRISVQFAEAVPQTRSKIRAAADSRDARTVAFMAHRLRGQAASFDAHAVVAAAALLEGAATRDDWAAAHDGLHRLEGELDRLLRALAAGTASVTT